MSKFLSALGRLLGPKHGRPAKAFVGLRKQALNLKPEQLSVGQDTPVLAVLMEMGYPGATVTMLATVDGAASMYLSTGGGVIGAGEYEAPRFAALNLIAAAADYLPDMSLTTGLPLPALGQTQFLVVTPKGVFTAEAPETDLGNKRHKLSPLFYVGQELIAQIRLAEEARRKGQPLKLSD